MACGLPPNGLIRPRALAEEMEEPILRALGAVRVTAGAPLCSSVPAVGRMSEQNVIWCDVLEGMAERVVRRQPGQRRVVDPTPALEPVEVPDRAERGTARWRLVPRMDHDVRGETGIARDRGRSAGEYERPSAGRNGAGQCRREARGDDHGATSLAGRARHGRRSSP